MRTKKNIKRIKRGNTKGANADEVVASTAGLDTWKTWAGRTHGSDGFQVLDLFRGMNRKLHNRFQTLPPPGQTCPVCFCDPRDDEEDEMYSGWYVTTGCHHAVCHDCLTAYTSNQLNDLTQRGPLKCPICPQPLRPSDAIVAFRGDKKLIRQWDLKIRNQVLQALPAFRPCPHCSNKDTIHRNNTQKRNESDSNNAEEDDSLAPSTGGGRGGFVTPECLAPHHESRRSDAAKRLRSGEILAMVSLFALFLIVIRYIIRNPSRSPIVDVFFMISSFCFVFGRLGGVAKQRVARWARRALLHPITVECPCCNLEFILPAQSNELEDKESKNWKDANSRPCPSCSVPINKDGGCNHMTCSNCNASFCWACMKLRTDCAAYNCTQGAPYRNASRIVYNADRSISAQISFFLDRQTPTLNFSDGCAILMVLFARDNIVIRNVVGLPMILISYVFLFIHKFWWLLLLGCFIYRSNTRYDTRFMSEEERINEVIQRSLRER